MATDPKLIVNLTRDVAVCSTVIADKPIARMRGLLGRDALEPGEGLLLRPAGSIHTAFMRFSIDALFLDRRLRVLGKVEQLRPWRIAGKLKARLVLELESGECGRLGVQIGDQLAIREPPGANGSDLYQHDIYELGDGPPAMSSNGGIGHPISVLVVSQDHRYRTVSSLLLTRRGYVVHTTADAEGADAFLECAYVDAIVLDVSSQPEAVQHVGASLRRLSTPIGLIMVAEKATEETGSEGVLGKWEPFEGLLRALERAVPLVAGAGPSAKGGSSDGGPISGP